MKIVHLCVSCFFIDGYSYQENILPKYHVKMGHDVTVVASLVSFGADGKPCLLREEGTYYDKDNGYKVIRLDYKRGMLDRLYRRLRIYSRLRAVLEQERPDIIFTHGVSFGSYRAVTGYMDDHPGTRLFGDSHADYVNSATNFLSKHVLHGIIWRHAARRLDRYMIRCFGVTPLRCDFLVEMYGLPRRKVDFLPMGVDDEAIPENRAEVRAAIREELSIPQDGFVIFTGGKIDERKNIHRLLDAVGSTGDGRIHVIICGTVTPEMRDVIESKVSHNVHLLGWCNAERVMACMVASDMACFPGTHSTLWEQAVGVGLPAVFKRWAGMTHVDNGGNCIFTSGDDTAELADTIKSLVFTSRYDSMLGKAVAASSNFRYSVIAKRAIGE